MLRIGWLYRRQATTNVAPMIVKEVPSDHDFLDPANQSSIPPSGLWLAVRRSAGGFSHAVLLFTVTKQSRRSRTGKILVHA
jgi:hypothetical protein